MKEKMKCENADCDNEIDKANCFITGVGESHKTFWCSEECYDKHIGRIEEED